MVGVRIRLQEDETRKLRALASRCNNIGPGLAVAGRAATRVLKDHFAMKQMTGAHKGGGKRSNFWRGVRDSVQTPKVEGNVIGIEVSHVAIGQKVHGGLITPKEKDWLTIPISPKAYGKTATQVEEDEGITLDLINLKSRGRFLAGKVGKVLTFFFVLKKYVFQDKDPTALPPDKKISDAAQEMFKKWLLARTE